MGGFIFGGFPKRARRGRPAQLVELIIEGRTNTTDARAYGEPYLFVRLAIDSRLCRIALAHELSEKAARELCDMLSEWLEKLPKKAARGAR